ncbi:J domain-containing protein, partial [Mesorhizobium sp. USDA-HM6]
FSGVRGAGRGDRRQPVQAADLNVTLDITVEEAATAEKVTAMFPDGRKMVVKLPAYVEDGQTIRLKGQGEQGPGQPGDALVKIHIRRHPRYRIEGRDLHVDLPVDLADAVLGAKVAVETPTGKLAVNVPAWSSSDKVLRLKGRGLPEKAGGHGDLYAHVRLMLPDGGNADLEALMRNRKG